MRYSTVDEQQFVNLTLGGPVRVFVKEGKIVRVTALEYDAPDDPKSWEIEARGQTFVRPNKAGIAPFIQGMKQHVYSQDRLLTPLKRVDFDPDGKRNPENRGISKYEPISWEEAMTIVSKEIVRQKETYGPGSIAVTGSSHDSWGNIGYRMSAMDRFWNLIGVTWIDHNPESWEGSYWGAIHAWGFHWRLGQPPAFDCLDDTFRHCETIVFWSSDPTSTSGDYGWNEQDHWRQHMKKLGIKFIFIDPFANYTAILDGDKILRPKPGTDATLALAIAYTWIQEGTYDKWYVENRTYGFDKWEAYVTGREDGVPKTPEWAEKISGVKACDIRALARAWASTRTTLAAGGRAGMGNSGRAPAGHEWSRMMVLLIAMQGLGKPGVNYYSTSGGAPSNWDVFFPGYADGGISGGSSGAGSLGPRGFPKRAVKSPIRQRLNRQLLPEAIINQKATWNGVYGYYGESAQQQFAVLNYPFEGYSPVHMIARQGASYIGTMMETNRWARMYRSPNLDFFMCQTIYNEPEARFADIILPVCTNLERIDIGEWDGISGYSNKMSAVNVRICVLQQKCIEPLGESKSDYEIYEMIADRLGLKERFNEGHPDVASWVKAMFFASDLPKFISWEKFQSKGYYIIPPNPDRKPTPAFRWFYDGRAIDLPDRPQVHDRPVFDGKGLSTPTGKIEFEAQTLKRFDPTDEERLPVPHYVPSWEGIDTTELLKKYPLQFISPHPRCSFHTQHDGKSMWNIEIPHHRRLIDGYRYWVMRIHPEDAEKRGIKDGDIVKIHNDRGVILCAATVTRRMLPGVVHAYGSGGGYDPQGEPGNNKTIDKGGTANQLTNARWISKHCPGMAPNACLVEVEKWEGGNA